MTRANSDDPATVLFERKLRIADSLQCRDLFAELETVDVDIQRKMRERSEIDQQLVIAQAQLTDAEALVSLNVEGRNETERKARKAQLLLDDAGYQETLSRVRELDGRRSELDVELDALRRQARRIEKQIDYRIAAMRFLAGSG